MFVPQITYQPASSHEIGAAMDSLKCYGVTPQSLVDVWKRWNGFADDEFVFYSTNSILEKNQLFETLGRCPGFLVFANDFGSGVALLNTACEFPQVFLGYMGSMSPAWLEDTGMLLWDWVEAGCPFDLNVYPDILATEPVIIRLDTMPAGGLKSLVQIRKLTHLSVGISELKKFPDELPVFLCETTYIRALRLAAEINKDSTCVSIRMKSSGECLSLANPFE